MKGQTSRSSGDKSILQKRYSAAQQFQAVNDLSHAAEQYRIFLADTLGEIASGRVTSGQYTEAWDNFDEALRLVPNFPMLQLEYARAAARSGNSDHAATLAKSLLSMYPKDTEIQAKAHAILGEALMKADKSAEAKEQFEAAVQFDASFTNGYQLAVADLNLGDIEAARKVFKEMVTSFGESAVLHMYFGQAYGNSDFQTDAVAEFQKAIARDPHLPGIHYSLAVAELASGGDSQLIAAESQLREEISMSPKDAPSYAALGHLLANHGQGSEDERQAELNLKQAAELDPKNPDTFLYLGQFYADHKRLSEAKAALLESISLTNEVARNHFQVQKAHYLLARVLTQSGDRKQAEAEFVLSQTIQKESLARDQGRLSKYLGENDGPTVSSDFMQPMQAIWNNATDEGSRHTIDAFEARMKPAIADSYNNLGAIAASGEQYNTALAYFQRAYQWSPSLPGLDFNWGRAAFAAANYAQAIAPLKRYTDAHPEDKGARRVLGLSQFILQDYASARVTLADLVSDPAEPPKVRFAYADSLLRTGDATAAIPLLELLQQDGPDVPEARSVLVEAYATVGRQRIAAGDLIGGTASLQKAITLDPSNSQLRQFLKKALQKPD